MKSIQGKFVTLVVISTILLTAMVGGVGIWTTSAVQEDSSNKILSLTCSNEAHVFDQELKGVQEAVDGCAEVVTDGIDTPSRLSDAQWLTSYLQQCESLVESMARYVPGVCTFYLRFEPSLSNPNAGFFYTKLGRDIAPTEEATLTDILAFDESDIEHVGWYYLPREAGKPLWLEPYYNKNIDVYMVSYVVPLYVKGEFVGVVGMDVDFDVMINMTRHIGSYATGTASLISQEGKVYYHPTFEAGSNVAEKIPELAPAIGELAEVGNGECSSIATFTKDGVERKCVASALRNDMYLLLSVETSEIRAPANGLLVTVVVAGSVIAILVVFAAVLVSRRIARPLVQLAEVAHTVAEGNLDVTMPETDDNEVGVLAHAFGKTIESLREHIERVNERAYVDSLTKVKNKAAYDVAERELNQEIGQGACAFALAMFDANGLKEINDQYGHQRGDEFLLANCSLICRVFVHSPVFRIGGDEFVAILRGVDFEHRRDLLATFENMMERGSHAEEPWRRTSLAAGIATFEEGDTSVEDVFSRADKNMYENKRIKKHK